ncbi:hypothetical protein Y032_0711g1735 [Ancylostoma ceylanicum]|uniref:Uncharacterized protein n=1 Tax=Ancylostoma ceylanicum TaxID=53326 RepID=A0A016WFG0_9BILA|nr:hypothetical protein Y032_0711g1735 [Ancylostoma ceylanicum]
MSRYVLGNLRRDHRDQSCENIASGEEEGEEVKGQCIWLFINLTQHYKAKFIFIVRTRSFVDFIGVEAYCKVPVKTLGTLLVLRVK